MAGAGHEFIQAAGRDARPFPDEFSYVAEGLESAKDAATQGRSRPWIADYAERLAGVDPVNEICLRTLQRVCDDNGFHRNGLLPARVRVMPSPCDQLADDPRKIACLFHGLVSFANSTSRWLMPAQAS